MSQLLCDLFYYVPGSIYTDSMFEEMWNMDKNQFVAILFYLRRHRRDHKPCRRKIIGRGEREIFHQAIIWMSHNKLFELTQLIPYIPDCGYWKDLLVLMGTPAESVVVNLFGNQLLRDYYSYNMDIPGLISLAAKWTPNEGSISDKEHKTFGKIAKFLGISRKRLRTEFIVPLRRYLGVTEQIVSDQKWQTINYSTMPRLSLKLHSKTFERNDMARFNEYKNGAHIDHIKKLVLPGSVNCILGEDKYILNPLINNESILLAIDISGSMMGFPITLGACLCAESGSSHWVPFRFDDSSPEVKVIPEAMPIIGVTFNDRIAPILNYKGIGYDMNTCIRIAEKLGKTHVIIVSNLLLDISEFPIERPMYITYWSVNTNFPILTNQSQLTIIEGYDINIYTEISKGRILTRPLYKDIILQALSEEFIVPKVA